MPSAGDMDRKIKDLPTHCACGETNSRSHSPIQIGRFHMNEA